jgi:hypothetical protein
MCWLAGGAGARGCDGATAGEWRLQIVYPHMWQRTMANNSSRPLLRHCMHACMLLDAAAVYVC